MFKSATFKLTMYYLAIIAVVSICFSVAIYNVASRDLAFGIHRQSERITRDFPIFSNSPYLSPGRDISESQSHLIGRLILMNVLVIVAAGGLSYLLARRTLQPIEAAHEQQKRFTADVSHELRTPLTALKMESEVALMDPGTTKDELRAVITSNIEESEKLTSLIENLLKLSRLDDSAKATLLSKTSLTNAVTDAYQQVEPLAKTRNITFNSKLIPDTYIHGEVATLTQLFSILLENAVKYSSSNSTVSVEMENREGIARVIICDQGTGIAKQDLEHVFERFYRADSSRTGTNGFGLGLSIAKLIADSHHGSITLSSKVGKGTTATVLLPTYADKNEVTTQEPTQKTNK